MCVCVRERERERVNAVLSKHILYFYLFILLMAAVQISHVCRRQINILDSQFMILDSIQSKFLSTFVHLSVHPPFLHQQPGACCLSASLSVHTPVCLSILSSSHLTTSLFDCQPTCLSICLSTHLSVHPSIIPPTCLLV